MLDLNKSDVPMTKALFLEQLRNGIATLPGKRIYEIEEDIRLHFAEGKASGATEDALCAMLGDPAELAAEYVSLYEREQIGLVAVEQPTATEAPPPPPPPKEEPKRRNPFLTGLIGFWMLIFALCLPFPAFMTLGALWLVLACGFLIAPCGVLALALSIISFFVPLPWVTGDALVNFFGSISCIALGGLMILGESAFRRMLWRLTERYLAFHKRVVTGRRGEER